MRKMIFGAFLLSVTAGSSNKMPVNDSNIDDSYIEQQKIEIIQSINKILEQKNILIGGSQECTLTFQEDMEKKIIQASLACDGERKLSTMDKRENIIKDSIGGISNIGVINGQLTPHGACFRISHLIMKHGKVEKIEDLESRDCKNHTI